MEEKTSIHAEFAETLFEDETSRNQSKADEDMTPYFLREGYPIPRVVEWYSPWCGHCQSFVPRYISIAEQVLQRLPPHSVEFHAISCQEHRHLCQEFQIKGYPTIRAYPARSKNGIDLRVFTVRSISDILDLGITNSHAVKSNNERLDAPAPSTMKSPQPQQQQQLDSSSQHDDLELSPKVDIIGASRDGHHHTHSDVYNDAARSFTHALEHHIFQNGQQALTDHQAETLSEWLDLLHWTLPPTWMIHTLIHDLRRNIQDIARSKELFMTILTEQRRVVHHDDLQWSDSCLEHGDGYSCGLWNLLHIMSIGVMERHHSVLGARDRVTTRHAAESVKNYIDYFFPFCPDCRRNFLASYRSCGYKRCRRFRQRTRNKHTSPSQESWREFPLWLWEVHNGIKLELLQNQTRASRRKLSAASVRGAQWPSPGACHACYKRNGNWNMPQVLKFLKDEYW
jgi:thiol-disulfide isomerase/thioredoxin